ncbi:MAG: hypothetical protein HY921_08935 [Elusimicrobia bacterium]|nr:hypothetical protein [Elusimicrobiota bacterium]
MNKIKPFLALLAATVSATSVRPVFAIRPTEADIAAKIEAHKCESGWTEADKRFTGDERCQIKETAAKARSEQEAEFFKIQKSFGQTQKIPISDYDAFRAKAETLLAKLNNSSKALAHERRRIRDKLIRNSWYFEEKYNSSDADKTAAARRILILAAWQEDRAQLQVYLDELGQRIRQEMNTRAAIHKIELPCKAPSGVF